MSNLSKDASEKTFQENFVKELKKYKWSAPEELDGNKHKVTVNDLINNWRKELNRINADQLEGVPLTDSEFRQVLARVNQISNSYEAAKILSIEGSKGKIEAIYRESNINVTREQITLTIFKKPEVSGGDSSYKIAREVQTDKGNRFDIVLLINGLPLINIEQKRTDKTLDEAFGQFKRYYSAGEYSYNFMAFSQMMVITTEVDTRYFATPKSIADFNQSFVFRWSYTNNEKDATQNGKPVTNWRDVIERFLMIPMAHQMVGDYLIIEEAKEKENRRHMVMRPYQVYALQAVERAALGYDNDRKEPHGGYVWHTTGSGKTITSFKTALFLSTRGGFDKVVFLVDRRELDNRTTESFKAYAEYESVTVDDTKTTYHLKKQMNSSKNGIIVTTTFKLNSLVKDLEDNQDYSLANKKIVFIVDEAHRTTMGQMMGTIKAYFKRNGLFYGFTGTPLFDENKVNGKIDEKSEYIDTTEKLFGPELHKYTIDEAISDGNVLGFYVDYINTGEFESYDDLRVQLVDKITEENPNENKRNIERKVQKWDEIEVEKESIKRGLIKYQDETHIPRVVEEILRNWDSQSQGKEFNAILTVKEKKRVIAYYSEFKKQMNDSGYKINVVMTCSFGNENEDNKVFDHETIKSMFKDYYEFTGIKFVAGDKSRGEDAYFEDIVERTTRGGSGLNLKNIDLVIVAEQLLTGYDSKRLNTLYVDRTLELQKLIQAYSRTNRVFGEKKEFGTIINFKYPRITEFSVNRALEHYGSGGNSSRAIMPTYSVAVQELKGAIAVMIPTLPEPTKWVEIKNDDKKKEMFCASYFDVKAQLRLVEQYYCYQWDNDTFGINEHRWFQYIGAYKNLFPSTDGGNTPNVVDPLVGKTKLVGTQVVDAAHILKLIGSKVNTSGDYLNVDPETLRIIYEQIQELSNMGEDNKAQMLKIFVDEELIKGKLPSNMNFDDAFDTWKLEKRNKEVSEFSEMMGIEYDLLLNSLQRYSENNQNDIPYIDEIYKNANYDIARDKTAGNKLNHNMNLVKRLSEWMFNIKCKYK